jgi:predicted N-acetyltransferase YhbS
VAPAEIRKLSSTDSVGSFTCGEPHLDRFLRKHALNNQDIGLSSTYVAVEEGAVVGFVTVSVAVVSRDNLPPANLPGYPTPVMILAKLGVAVSCQKRGIGHELTRHAFRVAVQISGQAGCYAVVVDPKPGKERVYRNYGFRPMPGIIDTARMYILVADILAVMPPVEKSVPAA